MFKNTFALTFDDLANSLHLIMNSATDDEENVNELKFGAIDFEKVQSLTQDEMYYLLTQRQKNGLTNE